MMSSHSTPSDDAHHISSTSPQKAAERSQAHSSDSTTGTTTSPITSDKKVVLRYYDCRGRADAIRMLLEDCNIAYSEERIPIVASGSLQRSQTIGDASSFRRDEGLFGTLPTLSLDDGSPIAHPLAIASFITEVFCVSPQDTAQSHADAMALAAHAHEELHRPCMALLWSPVRQPHAQLPALLSRFHARITSAIALLEFVLEKQKYPYFLGQTPCVGDYFMFDALETLMTITEGAVHFPVTTQGFHTRMRERPRLREYLESDRHPTRLSGCPSEQDVVAIVSGLWETCGAEKEM
jgi:glutathione S-transferase